KGLLFLVAFVAALALYAFSFIKALGVTMVYFREPQTMGEAAIAKALAWIQTHGPVVVKIAAVALAFFAAIGFSGEWQTWLLFRNAESFGRNDPAFGMDV